MIIHLRLMTENTNIYDLIAGYIDTHLNKNNYWIDPTKLQNYTLPTFTKKIVKFLESHK